MSLTSKHSPWAAPSRPSFRCTKVHEKSTPTHEVGNCCPTQEIQAYVVYSPRSKTLLKETKVAENAPKSNRMKEPCESVLFSRLGIGFDDAFSSSSASVRDIMQHQSVFWRSVVHEDVVLQQGAADRAVSARHMVIAVPEAFPWCKDEVKRIYFWWKEGNVFPMPSVFFLFQELERSSWTSAGQNMRC